MTERNDLDDTNGALFYEGTFLRSAFCYVLAFVKGKNLKTTIILLYAVFALTFWKYVPPTPKLADPETGRCVLTLDGQTLVKPLDGSSSVAPLLFLWNARKIWSAFFIMGVVPACVVKFVFHERLADYGLFLKSPKRIATSCLFFLPLFLITGWASGYVKGFYNVYPFNSLAGLSWPCLLVHTALYFFLYYLSWEFMFRGFIQLGLTQTLGAAPAVMIQVVLSTMLHYGHPITETLGCIAGGILWGYLVFRTKSIWSGWAQHALLGIALDWSLVLHAC